MSARERLVFCTFYLRSLLAIVRAKFFLSPTTTAHFSKATRVFFFPFCAFVTDALLLLLLFFFLVFNNKQKAMRRRCVILLVGRRFSLVSLYACTEYITSRRNFRSEIPMRCLCCGFERLNHAVYRISFQYNACYTRVKNCSSKSKKLNYQSRLSHSTVSYPMFIYYLIAAVSRARDRMKNLTPKEVHIASRIQANYIYIYSL